MGTPATGTVVIAGRVFPITQLQLRNGGLTIVASHPGPVPGCEGEPATVFGEDGQGICQSWRVTIPASACDVTIYLPLRITEIEVEVEA
jgi:hypothetical protein